MSLATSYVNGRKYTSRKLQVRYRVKQVSAQGKTLYEIHRFASKTYAYLGLTEAAAKSCQEAKIAQYMRQTRQFDFDGSDLHEREGLKLMAHIEAVSEALAWSVTIEVDEDDVVFASTAPANPSALFNDINAARNYDEGGDALFLAGAARTTFEGEDAISVAFEQRIEDFDGDALEAEIADSSSGPFAPMERACDDTARPVAGCVYTARAALPSTLFVRLAYGAATSNVIQLV